MHNSLPTSPKTATPGMMNKSNNFDASQDLHNKRVQHVSRSDDNLFLSFDHFHAGHIGSPRSFKFPNITPGVCPHQMDCDEYADATEVKRSLAKLSNDFDSGKLQAFGGHVTIESMLKIREQQENLARLHLELNQQQYNKNQALEDDFYRDDRAASIMTKLSSKSNMQKLMQNLQNLCRSIERLQLKSTKRSNEC